MFQLIKLKIYQKILFPLQQLRYIITTNFCYVSTLFHKKCYFGPFTGEFGHLLGHTLPFITFLHSKGVKVIYCGMEIHRPLFIDENGKSIVSSYLPIRDFFKEALPSCNDTSNKPEDIEKITTSFINKAKNSLIPYWNNQNQDYYYFFFRWWVLKNNYCKTYALNKFYSIKKEDAAVIFPRKKNPVANAKQIENNGKCWDYVSVAKTISRYFKKIYVVGHPVFSNFASNSFSNVEVVLTNNNQKILELCSISKLIVTQHSGAVYLGEYTDTQVLIIYKGGREVGEIEMTKQFNKGLGDKRDFHFAFSLTEIEDYVKQKKYEAIRN